MKVSIIGPGNFGTALAQVISRNNDEILLFGRNPHLIAKINQDHVNPYYHPLLKLNDNIIAYELSKERQLLMESDIVLFSVPSGVLSSVIKDLKQYLKYNILISTVKGVDYPSLKFMSQIINEETQNPNVFSISGPNFADELISNLFSAITLGINKKEHINIIKNLFSSPNLIVDTSLDVRGVELCGILKNVYAIALGIFDSQFYGNNPHYAFLNLCFKEMRVLLDVMGHDPNLSNNFCGFGDLNLTACVDKSRNRTLGLMIGKDIALDFEKSSITMEGFRSSRAIQEMSKNIGIDFPIINFVNTALNDRKYAKNGLKTLLEELRGI